MEIVLVRFCWKNAASVQIPGSPHRASFMMSSSRLCRITIHIGRPLDQFVNLIILVQTRKSGLYYDVDNQCTQLVVSSFFIGWKYWASNPSACSEDICQVFLKKQRICWMLPQFLWVQRVPGRRPSYATLP